MVKESKISGKRIANKNYSSGDRYGLLILTGKSYIGKGHTMVEYICACKEIKWTRLEGLISGNKKSCGCLTKIFLSKSSTKHGLHKHTLYGIYHGVKERCYNKSREEYPEYGGRGIEMYEGWLNSFLSFYNWAIGNGWQEGLTLERKKNDEGYYPYNCIWASMVQQSRNKRSNVILHLFGESKCATDWASDDRCKIGLDGLLRRVKKGWSHQSAITLPNVHINRKLAKEIIYK